MNDWQKWFGGMFTGGVLMIAAFLGFGTSEKVVEVTPVQPAPMALAGDARCPSPPRTGGAIFVTVASGVVHADGAPVRVNFLNCDYAATWSYTVRGDGEEQLANYMSTPPVVYTNKGEITRVLADLN